MAVKLRSPLTPKGEGFAYNWLQIIRDNELMWYVDGSSIFRNAEGSKGAEIGIFELRMH